MEQSAVGGEMRNKAYSVWYWNETQCPRNGTQWSGMECGGLGMRHSVIGMGHCGLGCSSPQETGVLFLPGCLQDHHSHNRHDQNVHL